MDAPIGRIPFEVRSLEPETTWAVTRAMTSDKPHRIWIELEQVEAAAVAALFESLGIPKSS